MAKVTATGHLRQENDKLRNELEMMKSSFRSLIESSADGMLIVDQNHHIRFANPVAGQMFGCSPEILNSFTFDYPVNLGQIREITIPKADGKNFYVEMHVAKAIWEGSEAFAVSLRDVTERKHALARLQQSEKSLMTILESVPFGILIIDKNKRIRKANRGALEIMGYESEHEVAGQTCQDVFCISESGGCPMIDMGSKFATAEKELLAKNGDRISVLKNAVMTTINDEEVLLEAFVDITDRKRAENELKAYHNWLDALLRTLPNPIFAKDREGRYTLVNKAFEEFFECTANQVIGKTVDECWPSDQAKVFHQKDMEMMGRPQVQRYEHKLILKNDTEKNIIYTKACFYTPDGKKAGIVGTITDVSEMKHAQEKIRRLSAAVEQSANAVIITDFNGNIEYINPRFTRVSGYGFEEVVGKNPRILNSGYQSREYYQRLWDTIKSGEVWTGEFFNKKKSGELHWEQATISPVKDDEGKIRYFLAIKEDITERKLAEDALALSEKYLSGVLESISAAVISIDEQGVIRRANRAAEKIFGYRIEEITGKQFERFVSQHRLEGERYDLKTVFADTSDLPAACKMRGFRRDGSEFCAEATVSKIDVAGKSVLIVMLTDTTQREKIQEQMLRNQRMESIGLLSSGIAHDMNNILTPILSGTDFLQPYVQNASAAKYLELMANSARRAADLIRQLLTFARGQEGQKTAVELGHLIAELKRFVRQTFPKTITFEENIASDLFRVSVDPTQMHQVLMNLLVNSRDAMPNGGMLKIQAENFIVDKSYARMHLEAREGPYVLITVTDTGEGIPQEKLSKIFEPFFTTKQPGTGTGLGLATVHSIIYKHGGFIRVTSQVGLGTSFTLFLPAITNENDEVQPMSSHKTGKGNNELILVVDDEDAIREVTSDILVANGYRVISASNGTGAVAEFAKHKHEVKVVILDMMMPIMDGPATIYALRSINPNIKAIGVSGLMDADAIAQKTGDAISVVLTKPYTAQTLLTEVHKLVEKLEQS